MLVKVIEREDRESYGDLLSLVQGMYPCSSELSTTNYYVIAFTDDPECDIDSETLYYLKLDVLEITDILNKPEPELAEYADYLSELNSEGYAWHKSNGEWIITTDWCRCKYNNADESIKIIEFFYEDANETQWEEEGF